MQRRFFLVGVGAIGFLGLIWFGWAPAAPPRAVATASGVPSVWAQRAPALAAVTPPVTATHVAGLWTRLDVHVEANAAGEGSAHVVASSQGGQALAHIDTKGQANGHAQADAPALAACNVCGGAGPMTSASSVEPEGGDWGPGTGDQGAEGGGQKTEGRGQKAEVTPASGQVLILVEANLRSGPGFGSAVIGGAQAGDRYAAMGRSADGAWFRVCCTADKRVAWVYAALAQWVEQPPPNLPPGGGRPPPDLPQGGGIVTGLPATLVPTVLSTVTPTPTLPFVIVEQEQHSEANYATLYVWVQDGYGVSLEGYRLQVTKNGAPVGTAVVRSTSYRQGTTRPSAPGGPEDKAYNLKLAFDPRVVGEGFSPVGAWAVQLFDPQGQPAAPLALFAIRPNDDHMEMYLNYGKR